MHGIMFFFFTAVMAERTSASWLSCMRFMNFFVLSARKFDFTYEKTYSIGLYSGLYGTL